MLTPTVYVLCDNNCKYEGMTKEQILTAIAQAIETGGIGNCDTGFISTIKTINGKPLKFFVGEQAEYDALATEQQKGLFAIITNDKTKEELLNTLETLRVQVTENDSKVNELLNNQPYTLNGFKDGNTRFIKGKFDLDTLNSTEHCGVYVLHHDALVWGQISGMPSDREFYNANGAKLIVEADCDDNEQYRAIYQTLKINVWNDHNNLLIYHRIYHGTTKEWDGWQRFVSAEELETGETKVASAKNADTAKNALKATNAEKATADATGNNIATKYAKVTAHNYSNGRCSPNIGSLMMLHNSTVTSKANPDIGACLQYKNGDVISNLYCASYYATTDANHKPGIYNAPSTVPLDGTWVVIGYTGFYTTTAENGSNEHHCFWLIQRKE